MKNYRYVYGPVPSRRMGLSLGISPIPQKLCNYSCVYCQLGRTLQMGNKREDYYPVKDILKEVKDYLHSNPKLDVITIVGEGEPTLYLSLGKLILGLKELTDKPLAVITNGALLAEKEVREELMSADIVLPSLDAYDEKSYKRINRPHGEIYFDEVYKGIQIFSQEFQGQLWLETMLMKGLNDDEQSLGKLKELIKGIKYNRLYINTPVRPPAESDIEEPSDESLKKAEDLLGGIAINLLVSEGFSSEEIDDYKAILSIIKRHPMNQHEINGFLDDRGCKDKEEIFKKLSVDEKVEKIVYKGYETYRGVSSKKMSVLMQL